MGYFYPVCNDKGFYMPAKILFPELSEIITHFLVVFEALLCGIFCLVNLLLKFKI